MTPGFCKFLLKITGWKLEGDVVPERSCVILEAPHTSIWDFFIGYLYYRSLGGHLRAMIKKEAFVFPIRRLIFKMGGFPIDRKNPQGTIHHIIREIESDTDRTFHLVMCPEGTRKAVRKWKTGYHTIARATASPVYLSCVDWGHRRVGIFDRIDNSQLTDDARADTDRIQHLYARQGFIGKHPEDYFAE